MSAVIGTKFNMKLYITIYMGATFFQTFRGVSMVVT